MWAQDWSWTYPAAVPYRRAPTIDVTLVLAARFDAKQMVRFGESFYTSIGMDPLPETFWQRSMFAKAKGKEAVCHASAWGASRPWQGALFELTGQREMDATAILEYFAPLQTWLRQRNRGEQCGW